MIRRIFAAVAVATALLLSLAPAASAQSGEQPTVTQQGNSITITVFADPFTDVTIVISSSNEQAAALGGAGFSSGAAVVELALPFQTVESQTVTANADGVATATFTGLDEGTYVADITKTVDGQVVTEVQTFTVQETAAQDTTATTVGTLPTTGSDSSLPLARIGAVLVAAGGIALVGARRRAKVTVGA